MTPDKSEKKTFIGITHKTHCKKGKLGWITMSVCCRKDQMKKYIDPKQYKKVTIIVEDL